MNTSRRHRAFILGVHTKTLKYRENPEYRARHLRICKESHVRHRAKRLEKMKEYYYKTYIKKTNEKEKKDREK